jgi:cyclase
VIISSTKRIHALKATQSLNIALACGVALLISATLTHGQGIPFDKIQIVTQQLAPHLYVLQGSPGVDPGHLEAAGGRIGVLEGTEGVLLVDAQYAPLTDKVVTAIHKFNSGSIRYLIDTHEHPDHTGGNPNFARMGAIIFAVGRTRYPADTGPRHRDQEGRFGTVSGHDP